MKTVSVYGTNLIRGFEGKPRLKARRCEGDAWELGYGCTYYPDGSPVKPGDTITEDRVEPMLAHCMGAELAPVLRVLDREPDQNWTDAFGSFAYNNGGHNVARLADAVKLFNAHRDEEAAAAFVGWISATSSGPTEGEEGDPFYAGVWKNIDGAARWIGPDGQPCEYRRKMRGLLRRRLAEGCVALGFEWEIACRSDAVFLERERLWRNGRWEDRVISMTQLKDVLPVARKYPILRDAPKAVPVEAAEAEPLPEIKPDPPKEVLPPPPAPKEKPVSPPKPAQLPYGSVEPIKDPKDMLASKRFWGLVIMIFSRFSFLGLSTQTWAGELVGDPILLDAASAGLAMGAIFLVDAGGQLLHWYGKRDAKAFLK